MIRLKNILGFSGLVVGVPQSIAHQLNWMDRAVVPDIVSLDQGGYTVTATSTLLTVTRNAGAPAAVNALVESWHSIERAFGARQTLTLNPQPIVVQGASPSSSGPNLHVQSFVYTVTGAEVGFGTNTITVPLPAPRASTAYIALASDGGKINGNQTVASCPVAGYTLATVDVVTSAIAAIGDKLVIFVTDTT